MINLKTTSLKFLLFCAAFLPSLSKAQVSTDCINSQSVCASTYTQPNSSGSFGTQELNGTNAGCLTVEHYSAWYVINVSSAGNLIFTITPNTPTDYDFALWDVTGVGCQAIYNGLAPIRCNYAALGASPPNGATGLNTTAAAPSYGAGGPSFSSSLPVVPGQTLVLLVDNFATNAVGYTLDFGGSTASILDTIKPKFAAANSQCSFVSDKITVTMSEPVTCSSIAADGSDFYITPTVSGVSGASGVSCSGSGTFTSKLTVQFPAVLPPGTYWLHSKQGTDGNTLFDNCGNQQLVGDSIQFVMNAAIPPRFNRLDTPACNMATIVFTRGVKCTTVAADGSDFTISGPSNVNVVSAVTISCDTTGLTDTVQLAFDRSIFVPGLYTLHAKVGSDGNSITDTCGLAVDNTINWYVSDRGYVSANATPSIICNPGYVNLGATATIDAPRATLNCGAFNTTCTNPSAPKKVGAANANIDPANSPFYGSYDDARTQMVYTAAELKAAGLKSGTISQLDFYIAANYSTAPYNNLTVKMGCTSLSDFSNQATYVPGMSVVYNPKTTAMVASNNYLTLPLDITYDWDGTSNIIVEVCYDNSSSTGNDAVEYNVKPNSVLHTHNDGVHGCSMTTPSIYTHRPTIRFTECLPPPRPQEYVWTPSTFVGDTASANTIAYVPSTTVYQIQIMDSNFCYRRDTASVLVSVRHPKLTGPATDTAICTGDHFTFHSSGGVTYNWYPAAGLSCTNCSDPVASPTTTTTYHVAIFDQYGCGDTLSRTIIVHPLPVITLSPDTTIIFGQQTQLYANVPGGLYYLWDPVTGLSDANIPNPIASPEVTTKYGLYVIDTNQCRNTDTIKVTVRTDVPVSVPNAFTPNGDGRNDFFSIKNLSIQRVIEFRVFNRWGQEVFDGNDNKAGWDGTYKGAAQETGVYNYIIRIASPDGKVDVYKGDVTLIR
ncbi:gliding motility-associated C-terminal domain-containing protein [Chitinophagaceae bacterium MMS25-I14]